MNDSTSRTIRIFDLPVVLLPVGEGGSRYDALLGRDALLYRGASRFLSAGKFSARLSRPEAPSQMKRLVDFVERTQQPLEFILEPDGVRSYESKDVLAPPALRFTQLRNGDPMVFSYSTPIERSLSSALRGNTGNLLKQVDSLITEAGFRQYFNTAGGVALVVEGDFHALRCRSPAQQLSRIDRKVRAFHKRYHA